MNTSQLASVAVGMVIFVVGVLMVLRTLAGGLAQQPSGTLVLAAGATFLGVTVALLGAYLMRDHC